MKKAILLVLKLDFSFQNTQQNRKVFDPFSLLGEFVGKNVEHNRSFKLISL